MSAGLRIGLLGCGIVGGGVAERLLRKPRIVDVPVSIQSVLVRDVSKPRATDGLRSLLTTDGAAVVDDPAVNLVVECLGGLDPAYALVHRAILNRKHVVSANKALLATHGLELFALAQEHGVELFFDAAVGGAVPLISTLRSGLAGERITEVSGVLNGTSNYILSAMEEGRPFAEALAQAQQLGFAEADPAADVDGTDAAQKLSLIAKVGFGVWLPWQEIPRIGIEGLTVKDMQAARRDGFALRLVARLKRAGDQIVAAVCPLQLPIEDPIARALGVQNVVRVIGEGCGELIFAGPGAGSAETASAIVGDLLAIARLSHVANSWKLGMAV